MFSLFFRGSKASYLPDSALQPNAIDAGQAKRAAWSFVIGESRSPAHPPAGRSLRRGDLPDVDFDNVVRVPRRSAWRKLAEVLRLAPSEAVIVLEEPAAEDAPTLIPLTAIKQVAVKNNVIPFRRAA